MVAPIAQQHKRECRSGMTARRQCEPFGRTAAAAPAAPKLAAQAETYHPFELAPPMVSRQSYDQQFQPLPPARLPASRAESA
jgi:hypothetical protein